MRDFPPFSKVHHLDQRQAPIVEMGGYGHIIYPESMQMLWLALFVFFAHRQTRRDAPGNYVASLIFATLALYYKEPTFALVLPAAVLPLITRGRSCSRAQKLWSVAMLVSVAVWFGLYYFLVYARKTGVDYASVYNNSETRLEAFTRLFLEPSTVYLPMAVLGVYRGAKILRAVIQRRGPSLSTEHVFIDALLFGGLGYVAAFATLRMADFRFLPPCNVLFAVVCFYYACRLVRRRPRPAFLRCRDVVALLLLGVLFFLVLRLAGQIQGFRGLHGRQQTWAPNLRIVANHSQYPIIYVYPDPDATPAAVESGRPLNLAGLNDELRVMELQKPPSAPPLKLAYLDIENDLPQEETLPGSEVKVIPRPPASGNCFFFVPPHVEDFAQTMRNRFDLEVVRISRFAFEDRWVREIWAPRRLARRLPSPAR